MFLFTKLDKDAQKFISTMPSMGSTRGLGVSIAIARVLSNGASVPSSPVDDISSYYNQNVDASIYNNACTINELLVIDLEKVRTLAKQFYILRYAFLYPKEVYALSADNTVEDFFGLSRHLGNEVFESIKNDRTLILYVQIKIIDVLKQLNSPL